MRRVSAATFKSLMIALVLNHPPHNIIWVNLLLLCPLFDGEGVYTYTYLDQIDVRVLVSGEILIPLEEGDEARSWLHGAYPLFWVLLFALMLLFIDVTSLFHWTSGSGDLLDSPRAMGGLVCPKLNLGLGPDII